MAWSLPPENSHFANRRGSFVNDSTLTFTLRRWRAIVLNRRSQAFAAILAVTVTVVAPFGTGERMGPALRLLYWCAIVASHAAIAIFIVVAVSYALRRWIDLRWARVLVAGCAAALPLALVQTTLAHILDGMPLTVSTISAICFSTLVITVSVTTIVGLLQDDGSAAAIPATVTSGRQDRRPIAFLERLPPSIGRDLINLSMQDHYIDVRTAKGSTLVLLRFSDAVRELEGADGLQIHRSHWVARTAVARLHRDEGRLVVELLDGRRLPVSRSFAAAVRDAGFPEAP